MRIGKRYLEGREIGPRALRERPLRSRRIEAIFRQVRRRVEK